MPGVCEILGRENEIDDLVEFLRNDAYSSIKEKFSVVSIVGIGGVGKTSLAQHVYNDSRIDVLFDLKVWVCVRQKFNIKRITRQVLESVSSFYHHQLTNLDKMQATLKDRLMKQRFLIVLDDVWNEVRSLWEMLRKPFNFGKNGSRVLVTTRIHKVAKMMETKATIQLEGLKDQDYAKFFDYCAFGDANPKEHPKLQLIGRRIAMKLAGSPLAAKTVGSLLKCYLEEEHWMNIMESKLWQMEQQQDDIFPALKLSYEHLPTTNLKQCFVYFSLFPKDYYFDKDRMIRIWMAQGFLESNNSRRRMEDIGREFFDELVHRSFLQEADDIRPKKYVIHDLLHELAESLSADEYCRLEDGDGSEAIPQRVRHMYINSSTLSTVKENVSKLRNLHTLVIKGSLIVNVSKSNLMTLMEDILKQFKFLRALILDDLPLEVTPDSISYLIHLRYLEILGRCAALPDSLCKLYHLQGLELQFHVLPSHARIIPAGMHKLVNMRYLNTKPGKVSTSISFIGNLSFLQELKEFHVRKETGFDLRQLSNLRQLRGQLSIMSLEMATDGRDAKLENKEHLSTVHLCWGQNGIPKHHEEVLEALRPHPNLTELRIIGYMGTKSPSWLKESWLSNLECIELEACNRLEILPTLGQLPFLRSLHLKSLASVKEIDAAFHGQDFTAFPLLEELLFSDMKEWTRWLGVPSNLQVFPRLRKLNIDGCSKLQGPLVLPSLLKKLHIVLSDDITWELSSADQLKDVHSVLSEDNTSSSTLKLCTDNIFLLTESLQAESLSLVYRLDIVFFQSLVSFTDEQEEWFKRLISLKKVSFIDCDRLVALPKDLKTRASLESLHVENCPKICS